MIFSILHMNSRPPLTPRHAWLLPVVPHVVEVAELFDDGANKTRDCMCILGGAGRHKRDSGGGSFQWRPACDAAAA